MASRTALPCGSSTAFFGVTITLNFIRKTLPQLDSGTRPKSQAKPRIKRFTRQYGVNWNEPRAIRGCAPGRLPRRQRVDYRAGDGDGGSQVSWQCGGEPRVGRKA